MNKKLYYFHSIIQQNSAAFEALALLLLRCSRHLAYSAGPFPFLALHSKGDAVRLRTGWLTGVKRTAIVPGTK